MLYVLDTQNECKYTFKEKHEAFNYVSDKLRTLHERKYYIFDEGNIYYIYSHYRKILCMIIGNDPGKKNIEFEIHKFHEVT